MLNCDNKDARSEECTHVYHAMWMAHWGQPNCESAGVRNHFSFNGEKKKYGHDNKQASLLVRVDEPRKYSRLDIEKASPSNFSKHGSGRRPPGGLQIQSDGPKSAKFGAVNETERVEVRNEALSMKSLNFNNFKKGQSFPITKFDDGKNCIFTSNNDLSFYGGHQLISQIDNRSEFGTNLVLENEAHLSSRVLASAPTGVKSLSEAHHPAEGVSQRCSGVLVEPLESLEKKNFPVLRTLQDNHSALISNFRLYGFETQGLPLQSLVGRNGKNNTLISNECTTKFNFATTEQKNCNYHAFSTFSFHDEKMSDRLTDTYSGSPSLEEKYVRQKICDPLTSEVRFPIFVGKQGKRCNLPGSEILPSPISAPVVTKSRELNYGSHSLHHMPKCSLHDGKALRRSMNVESGEALPGSPPKVSWTSHHLPVTEKFEVNLSEGCKMLRESTPSTRLKGVALYEILTLPSDFCHDTNLGAKLRSHRNSGATEEADDVWNAKPGLEGSENESSAETDVMDVDVLRASDLLTGAVSYPSKEDICQKYDNPKEVVASLGKKIEKGKAAVVGDLPDMNQESPASAKGDGMDDRKLSSSRTESLEAERLVLLGKQPGGSAFSPRQDHQCLEPDRRWVKRLKLNPSDSLPHGTKYLKIGEASSSRRANSFSKILNHKTNFSQDMRVKNFGREKTDNKMTLLGSNGNSPSTDLEEECAELTYSWVRRWCHNKAAAQLVKPQRSKEALHELERKQFPSIGAMALMGKAMNCVRPCVFRRRGSFVVWNNNGY